MKRPSEIYNDLIKVATVNCQAIYFVRTQNFKVKSVQPEVSVWYIVKVYLLQFVYKILEIEDICIDPENK